MGYEYDTRKQKKFKHLSEKERYKIETLRSIGKSPKEIASELGRDRRTIERELKKGTVEQMNQHLMTYSIYLADVGQRVKRERAENKGRSLKIGADHDLVEYLERKIRDEKYSPEAAIEEAKKLGLEFRTSICTKTVYNYIDMGLFLGLSNKDLPVKKDKKKKPRIKRIGLKNPLKRSIEERPEYIDEREDFGHWEMDCVVGSSKECLLVLTERKYRIEKIFKMKNKTQENVKQELDKLERKHRTEFSQIFKSITMDNGSEFINMEYIEKSCIHKNAKRTTAYYAHPYSSYERGSNENANRLIRRFIPKGSDIGAYTKKEIKRIEMWINNYPRRMFGFNSANEMLEIAA